MKDVEVCFQFRFQPIVILYQSYIYIIEFVQFLFKTPHCNKYLESVKVYSKEIKMLNYAYSIRFSVRN